MDTCVTVPNHLDPSHYCNTSFTSPSRWSLQYLCDGAPDCSDAYDENPRWGRLRSMHWWWTGGEWWSSRSWRWSVHLALSCECDFIGSGCWLFIHRVGTLETQNVALEEFQSLGIVRHRFLPESTAQRFSESIYPERFFYVLFRKSPSTGLTLFGCISNKFGFEHALIQPE